MSAPAEGPSSSAENETGTLTPTLPSHGAGHSATQVEFLVGGYRQKSAVSVTSNAASGGGRKRSFQCVICGRTFKKRKFFDDHEQLCRQASTVSDSAKKEQAEDTPEMPPPLVSVWTGPALKFELVAECSKSLAR
ncbi:unnamed protein product, partial [Dibothriocephalus latus]